MSSSKAELSGKILVVDDNEMNRDMLSRRLARRGLMVEVAEDGSRALEMIESGDFDLVLLDIMMPGIDGYEVLERVRREHGAMDLPIIMATARSESEDVVRALKIGANDYVTKPFDFPVVMARVRTQITLKISRDELARAHRRMKKDLEAAARIQQTLLPPKEPEVRGARCAWRYVPCDELAGDTLGVVSLDQEQTGLYVLDVSGHGVPAALLSFTLSRMISETAPGSSPLRTGGPDGEVPADPDEVMLELSRLFPHDPETRKYFTMVYGLYDARNRVFSYCSAGHTPLVHVPVVGEPSLFETTGPPVALIPPILGAPSYSTREISLQPGDRLYLLSDGLPEAENVSRDEEFGMARIAEVLEKGRILDLEESLENLLKRVWEFGGGTGPDDDVSLLAIEAGEAGVGGS